MGCLPQASTRPRSWRSFISPAWNDTIGYGYLPVHDPQERSHVSRPAILAEIRQFCSAICLGF